MTKLLSKSCCFSSRIPGTQGSEKRTIRRLLSVVAVLLLLSSGIAFANGSSESSTKSSAPQGKQVLRVQALSWILGKFPMKEAAADFMKNHPNVTVEVSGNPDGNLNNYMLNWSAGNIDVDLGVGGSIDVVAKLGEKGLLQPWNSFYTGEFKKSAFLSQPLEIAQKGGEYYAFPFMVEGMALEANKKMLQQAGLMSSSGTLTTPLDSLDALYTYAKKLTQGTGDVKKVYGFSWCFTNFMLPQLLTAVNDLGGQPYKADGTPNFESPQMVQVLSFLKKVTMDGYGSKATITDTNAGRSGLKAGTVALIFEAASRATEAEASIGKDAIMLPFPGMQKHGSYIFAHYVYIPKGSKVGDLARQFVKEEILSQSFAAYGANKFGKLPILKANYKGLNADFSEVQKWLANPGTIGDKPYVESAKLNTLIGKVEQQLVTSDMTPQQAADELSKGASQFNLTVVH